MSENKKRISKAQVIVIVSIVASIAVVTILSLILHAQEPQGVDCCPWCFGACPWCWLIVALAIILVYAAVLLAMTAVKAVATAVVAAVPRHKAQRHVNIPRQKKERRHGHTLRHAKQYDATVSLKQLTRAFEEGSTVTIEKLKEMGIVPANADGYKVLVSDNEKLDRKLTIYATSFSAQAKHAIHEGGGQAIKVYH